MEEVEKQIYVLLYTHINAMRQRWPRLSASLRYRTIIIRRPFYTVARGFFGSSPVIRTQQYCTTAAPQQSNSHFLYYNFHYISWPQFITYLSTSWRRSRTMCVEMFWVPNWHKSLKLYAILKAFYKRGWIRLDLSLAYQNGILPCSSFRPGGSDVSQCWMQLLESEI